MKWTEELSLEFVNLYDDKTTRELAAHFGCSEHSVRWMAKRLGLTRIVQWEPYEDELLKGYRRKRYSNKEIAVFLSRSEAAISRRIKKLGWKSQKAWMEKEDRYLLMMCGEISVGEMAKKLKRTKGAVATRLSQKGIKASQGKRTLVEASEILGIGKTTVANRIKKLRLKHVVIGTSGDISDEMLVRLARSFIAKPNERGACNLSMRLLKSVIAEYSGSVKVTKPKRARKTGKGEQGGSKTS